MKRFLQNSFTACADGLVWFSRAFGRKAWIIFLFILGITVAVLKPTIAQAQTRFNDIQGTWAQPCIEQLTQRQILSGYPDGSFKPNAPVTRAEFAAMLGKAFPDTPAIRTGGKFADVSTNYWASAAIQKAYQTGFLAGYPGGVFNPTQNIPRVQALVSLASGLKYVPVNPTVDTLNGAFSDVAGIPEYSRSAIAAAIEKGLVVNYPEVRKLNSNQLASRADVAAFLCQATGTVGSIPAQYIAKVGTPPSDTAKAELRGVWLTNIDSNVLFSSQNVTNAIQRLKELNFNTVYPTVWNWGYTLYPSQVAEQVTGRAVRLVTPLDASLNPDLGVQGRDMLKEMVEQGHQNGIRVIPWFEFGFMAPADSELAKRHPDWLTQNSKGVKTKKEGTHDRVWLNPFKPEVQQFIQDLVVEIVNNYDVDGIQFDDHFGLPSDLGYDPFTIELYKKEHQGKSPSTNPQDAEWVRWRANKITDYLTKVFRAVKDRKPNVILSVSPNPQKDSYQFFLADWANWERRGLVEELIVQIYRDSFNTFISELEQPEVKAARSHIPVGIGILTGLRSKPISLSQIQKQVDAVRQRGFAGVSFFFYETLWNNASEPSDQRQAAFRLLFPMPAEPPDLLEALKSSKED
ncbi:family 10 glycosylhydrolase [Microcoleus sp. FACHB-SPT15]|uniref:glycoside hydrolase family 10 protein n=1 Tax=Microcoleus sp. FACHB-SPT15 TaxID=2692830 RepID=UPI0017830145|nr:family 10 glycosylhydrolase [Microcoleus sp. FACHB-SPT15]MBD1804743.1 family 10 glycosylhydrolase [Microcoleus sp. FACHB-SPT15]